MDKIKSDVCPECNSTRVWVGNSVLSCVDCGWHHLNRYPCDVCGMPSSNKIETNGAKCCMAIYRCNKHSLNYREIIEFLDKDVTLVNEKDQ